MDQIVALAMQGEELSPTLGSAGEFLLWKNGEEKRVFPFPGKKKLPLFLKEEKVTHLICGGIGNCMAELLSSMGIELLPGVEGKGEDVLERFSSGSLSSGKRCFCTDYGQSCGACPGYF